jgi:ADP-ribose pyrophosphatase YjhB (NUDIX family)
VSPAAEPARRTRLGAYAVCVDEQGRVLLCRISPGYPATGEWTLPGGGVEFGEHPDAAVLRELEEETGLRGRIEEMLGVYSRLVPASETVSGAHVHVVGVIYRLAIVGGGEIRVEVDGSTDACGWFARDHLAGMNVGDIARLGLAHLFHDASP